MTKMEEIQNLVRQCMQAEQKLRTIEPDTPLHGAFSIMKSSLTFYLEGTIAAYNDQKRFLEFKQKAEDERGVTLTLEQTVPLYIEYMSNKKW